MHPSTATASKSGGSSGSGGGGNNAALVSELCGVLKREGSALAGLPEELVAAHCQWLVRVLREAEVSRGVCKRELTAECRLIDRPIDWLMATDWHVLPFFFPQPSNALSISIDARRPQSLRQHIERESCMEGDCSAYMKVRGPIGTQPDVYGVIHICMQAALLTI